MTKLHYQGFVSAAVSMYVYEAGRGEQPLNAKRHYAHAPGGGQGSSRAFERPRAHTYSQTASGAQDEPRGRSSTIAAERSLLRKKQSIAVVKSSKGSLKGSVESLPGALTQAALDRKAQTKALEDTYGFRRVGLFSDKELDDPARGRRSPRTRSGTRTPDTLVSVDDAEPIAFAAADDDFIDTLNNLPGDRPVEVEVEFHGSDGSCGASEADALAEGCKGRAWQFSQTLANAFLKSPAAPGSTLTASSFYLNPTKDTKREMPAKRFPKLRVTEMASIPTYYGYKTGVTRVLYGPEADPNGPRIPAKSYELYKRVIGRWDKP